MASPYVQVALTYVRRWWSIRNCLILLSVIFVTSVCVFVAKDKTPPFVLLIFAVWTIQLFAGVASHIRQQFADARSHLTPGFRRVHVAVATAVILSVAVFLPAVLTWCFDLHSVGLVALSLALFAAVLWVILLASVWSSVAISALLVIGLVALFSESFSGTLVQFAHGRFETTGGRHADCRHRYNGAWHVANGSAERGHALVSRLDGGLRGTISPGVGEGGESEFATARVAAAPRGTAGDNADRTCPPRIGLAVVGGVSLASGHAHRRADLAIFVSGDTRADRVHAMRDERRHQNVAGAHALRPFGPSSDGHPSGTIHSTKGRDWTRTAAADKSAAGICDNSARLRQSVSSSVGARCVPPRSSGGLSSHRVYSPTARSPAYSRSALWLRFGCLPRRLGQAGIKGWF